MSDICPHCHHERPADYRDRQPYHCYEEAMAKHDKPPSEPSAEALALAADLERVTSLPVKTDPDKLRALQLAEIDRHLAELRADRERLRRWKCEHGGCDCQPPDSVSIEYDHGGLFPQLRGWYARISDDLGDRGPYDSRHRAVCVAREESES